MSSLEGGTADAPVDSGQDDVELDSADETAPAPDSGVVDGNVQDGVADVRDSGAEGEVGVSDADAQAALDGSAALVFGGTAEVRFPMASSLEPAAALTVEAWVVQSQSSATAGTHTWIVGAYDFGPFRGGGDGYMLGFDWAPAAAPSFYVGTTNAGTLGCVGGVLVTGVHHLAGTFEGTTGKLTLWVDGSAVCTTMATGTGPFTLAYGFGASALFGVGPPGTGSFVGTLDDVRISNAALYTSNFTPERHPTTSASTAGVWSMNEGSGTTVGSPVGPSGTIEGNATWVAEP